MLDRRRFVALSPRVRARAGCCRARRCAQAQTGPTASCAWSCRFRPAAAPTPSRASSPVKLSAIWGQQMVVENKGGGATSIGTDTVAQGRPDGYTVLLQSVPLAVNKFLFATLPFDPVADLAPVSLICDYPNVMAVPMSSPAKTVQEFIDLRQGQSRQGHLCLVRPRHLGASVRRAVQHAWPASSCSTCPIAARGRRSTI